MYNWTRGFNAPICNKEKRGSCIVFLKKQEKKKRKKKDHESKDWYCVEPKISTNRSKNNHSIHTVCEMPSIFRRQCYIQPNVSVIRVIPHTKRESWISIVAIDQLHNLCLPNFYSINIKSIHEIFIRTREQIESSTRNPQIFHYSR